MLRFAIVCVIASCVQDQVVRFVAGRIGKNDFSSFNPYSWEMLLVFSLIIAQLTQLLVNMDSVTWPMVPCSPFFSRPGILDYCRQKDGIMDTMPFTQGEPTKHISSAITFDVLFMPRIFMLVCRKLCFWCERPLDLDGNLVGEPSQLQKIFRNGILVTFFNLAILAWMLYDNYVSDTSSGALR